MKIAMLVALAGMALASTSFLPVAAWIVQLVHWMRGAGLWGALAYGAAFALAAVLMVPGSVFAMGAGMAYGPVWGTLLASPAGVIGAALAFLLARASRRGSMARWTASDPRLRAVQSAVGDHGLKIVILLRLSPIFPYNVLNYALGVSGIGLRDYLLGSFVGMLPGAVMYAYIGSLLGDVAAVSVDAVDAGLARHAMSVVGLAATIAVVIIVARLARRALADEMARPPLPVPPR
jgi:uncharacterized membrane protein YdjX (TVP38/TMEM64 family)